MATEQQFSKAVQAVLEAIHQVVERADQAVQQFQDKLADDPVRAMSWSQKFIDQVAKRQVGLQVRAMLQNGQGLGDVMERANAETMVRAQFPERSTSAVSDLVSQAVTSAWAEFSRTGSL